MMEKKITIPEKRFPVGMPGVRHITEEILARAEAFRSTGISRPAFLIALDRGEGRTFLAECLCDILEESEIIRPSGRVRMLELETDGSREMTDSIFDEELPVNALWAEEFEGLEVYHLDRAMSSVREEAGAELLKKIAVRTRHSAVIIFVPLQERPGRAEFCRRCFTEIGSLRAALPGKLADELTGSLTERSSLPVREIGIMEAYGPEELAEIALRRIETESVALEPDEESFRNALVKYMKRSGLKTVREALTAAELLIMEADYGAKPPLIAAKNALFAEKRKSKPADDPERRKR